MATKHLTDNEICKKFGVRNGTDAFDMAKRMSETRPDRTHNDFPYYCCPHCAEYGIRKRSYANLRIGDKLTCENCKRAMYVVDITIQVKLSTEKDD